MTASFSLRQLRYFVQVAEEGQLTSAAAKLHIAQPALSQTINKLETALGVQLLERHARGVRLTNAGVAFFEKAQAAVIAADQAEAVVGPFVRGERGLVVGFMAASGRLVRPLLRRFAERHADVAVSVSHLTPETRIAALKQGAIDVELILSPEGEDGLVYEELAPAARYVVLNEHHRLAGEQALCYEQISTETFPGCHPSIPRRWAEEAWLLNYRGSAPPVTVQTPRSLDELWTLIHDGRAIAILPDFMLETVTGEGVRAIPLQDVEPMRLAVARRAEDERGTVLEIIAIARELLGAGEPAIALEGRARRPSSPREGIG